ncbi:MAG: hypothetical protein D6693_04910 [Planctomycetota bacterium]|nr:MAG: hypothetical protein D6693_04910 [Planctomycetota bacterium]
MRGGGLEILEDSGQLHLTYGPVAGFTTRAYPAPAHLVAPIGAVVPLHLEGAGRDAVVVWSGDAGVTVSANGATCVVNSLNDINVSAFVPATGKTYSCVIEPAFFLSRFRTLGVRVDPSDSGLDSARTNAERVAIHMNTPSISTLSPMPDGSFALSVNGSLSATATTRVFSLSHRRFLDGSALAPLLEWRVDGKPVGVGEHRFTTPGRHTVSVGPPSQASTLDLIVYRVDIQGPGVSDKTIPIGTPLTYTATTTPPGFEDHVTWLASTKFGSAEPALGRGASFTTMFRDTFGEVDGSVARRSWVGIRADNVGIGSDITGDLIFSDPDGAGPWTPSGPGWTIGAPLSDLGNDPDFAGSQALADMLASEGAGNLAVWFKSEDAPVGDDVFQDADSDGVVDAGLNPAPFGTLDLAPMVVPVSDLQGNPLTVNLSFSQLAQSLSTPALGSNATAGGGTAIIFDDFELRWTASPTGISIHIWMKIHILAKITTTSKVWTFHKDVKSNGDIFNVFHTGMRTTTTTAVVHIPGAAHAWAFIPFGDFIGGAANVGLQSLGQAMYDTAP